MSDASPSMSDASPTRERPTREMPTREMTTGELRAALRDAEASFRAALDDFHAARARMNEHERQSIRALRRFRECQAALSDRAANEALGVPTRAREGEH